MRLSDVAERPFAVGRDDEDRTFLRSRAAVASSASPL
jgi:hypothetical protein